MSDPSVPLLGRILRWPLALSIVFYIFSPPPVGILAITTLSFVGVDLIWYPVVKYCRPDRIIYRFIQAGYQLLLYWAAWNHAGWRAAIAAAIIWWTGGCDILYYLFGGYKLHPGEWNWLRWTPWGFIRGGKIYTIEVVIQAITGLLVSTTILYGAI